MKRVQRVVLDTNVFLSGIFWSGPPYEILKAWQEQRVRLVLSMDIFKEYQRVFEILAAKYKPINLSSFLELVAKDALFYEPLKLAEKISRDPDDDKFIACALAAKVDYLVSGDQDLLLVSGYQNLKIIKPRQFVDQHLGF